MTGQALRRLLIFCLFGLAAEDAWAAKTAMPAASKTMSLSEQIAEGRKEFSDLTWSPEAVGQSLMGRSVTFRNQYTVQTLDKIMDRLLKAHEAITHKPLKKLSIYVVSGSDTQCATPPGGGWIECSDHTFDLITSIGPDSDDQLAFLLAHEIAHLSFADHQTKFGKAAQMKSNWQTMAGLVAIGGFMAFADFKRVGQEIKIDASKTSNNFFFAAAFAGSDVAEGMANIAAPSWSRKDEDEADEYAVLLMTRAGYRPSQAAQLLGTIHKEMLARGEKTTVLGKMLAGGAAGAARSALMTKADKTSTIAGGLGGAFAGLTQGAAHYHRDDDKRAERCSKLATALDPTPAAEQEDAYAMIGQPAQASAATKPAPAQRTAMAAPSKGKGKGKGKTKSGGAQPRPQPLEDWQVLAAERPMLADLALARRVDLAISRNKIDEAIALCPASVPRTTQLALSCGIARAGKGDAKAAQPMLAKALADPNIGPADFGAVAKAQASLGNRAAAFAAIASGHARFPGGELYPDEIFVRSAFADAAGALASATQCKARTKAPIRDYCVKMEVALQSS